jgi:hypothetical protein
VFLVRLGDFWVLLSRIEVAGPVTEDESSAAGRERAATVEPPTTKHAE